jgi:Amidohydrolase family
LLRQTADSPTAAPDRSGSLTVEQIIASCTINAARAIGWQDRIGSSAWKIRNSTVSGAQPSSVAQACI